MYYYKTYIIHKNFKNMKTTLIYVPNYTTKVVKQKIEIPDDIFFRYEDDIYSTVVPTKKYPKFIHRLNKIIPALTYELGDFTLIDLRVNKNTDLKITDDLEGYCKTINFNIQEYLFVYYNNNCVPFEFFKPISFTSLNSIYGMSIMSDNYKPDYLKSVMFEYTNIHSMFDTSFSKIRVFKGEDADIVYTTIVNSLFNLINSFVPTNPIYLGDSFVDKANSLLYDKYKNVYNVLNIDVKSLVK